MSTKDLVNTIDNDGGSMNDEQANDEEHPIEQDEHEEQVVEEQGHEEYADNEENNENPPEVAEDRINIITEYSTPILSDLDQIIHSVCALVSGNRHLKKLELSIGPNMTTVGANQLGDCIQQSTVEDVTFNVAHGQQQAINETVQRGVIQALFAKCAVVVTGMLLICPISDDDATEMTRVLLSGPSAVTTFGMEMGELSTTGVRILAEGIRRSNIHTLIVIGTEELAPAITAAITGNTTASPALEEKMRILYLQGIVDSNVKKISIYKSLGSIHALVTILPFIHSINLYFSDLGISDMELIMTSIRQSPKLQDLVLSGCGLRDEHIRILASGLPSHLCIDNIDLSYNQIGDAGVIALIENMSSSLATLVLDHNLVGPLGAQRLIQASCTTDLGLKKLSLAFNAAIGYEGLTKIGEALSDSGLTILCLISVAKWVSYETDDDDPENSITRAQIQWVQYEQANRALVTGVRNNVHLHVVDLRGDILLSGAVFAEIKFYTDMNQRCGRYLLQMQHMLPFAFWCHLLAKFTNEGSVIFAYLRELPMLMVPSAESAQGRDSKKS
jgi:hypothetical protein